MRAARLKRKITLRAGSSEDGGKLLPVLHKAVVLVRSFGGYGQVFSQDDLGLGIAPKPVHAENAGIRDSIAPALACYGGDEEHARPVSRSCVS